MAISSPRFLKVPQIAQAAANSPWMSHGARGHGVHLIQFALIDLGFAMPRSTGGRSMSPDGIYGSETAEKVREFQRSPLGGPPVIDDGIVGANTMAKLDRAIGGHTHRTEVHMLTTKKSQLSLFHMVDVAKEVYGHYGIHFDVRPGLCVDLSDAEDDVMEDHKSTKVQLRKVVNDNSNYAFSPNHTVAVQIGRFDPDTVFGLTDSDASMAICRISDDATEATLGHEVGHVLLTPASGHDKEDHTPHVNNLMTDRTEVAPYVLTLEQVTEMRGHARCRKI